MSVNDDREMAETHRQRGRSASRVRNNPEFDDWWYGVEDVSNITNI